MRNGDLEGKTPKKGRGLILRAKGKRGLSLRDHWSKKKEQKEGKKAAETLQKSFDPFLLEFFSSRRQG
jgi:hypothetical protein